MTVNDVVKGDVLAVIRTDDILIPVDDLDRAGVKGFGGKREEIKKRTFVSLASLAPEVKYEIDPKAVELKISVQAKHLGGEVMDLRRVAPPQGLFYTHDPSMFLNYSVAINNFNTVNSFDEVGMNLFGNSLLDSTFSVSGTGELVRTATNLTIDDRPDLRRLSLGDVFSSSPDPLSGGAGMGGVSISKSLYDPYFVQSAGDSIRADVLSPSTVEVYVNGRRVFKEDLPPGIYTLQNIPYANGAGNTQVIIRDAFGREQDFTQPYYYAPALLQPGLNLYNLALGFERAAVTSQLVGTYNGPFVFSGSESFGFTHWLTPGLRLEGDQSGMLSGGLTLNFGVPIGSLFMAAGASEAPNPKVAVAAPSATPVPTGSGSQMTIAAVPAPPATTGGGTVMGYAGSLSYGYGRNFYSFGGNVTLQSSHYANLSLAPTADRITLSAEFGGTLYLGAGASLSGSVNYSKDRDTGTRESALMTATYRLGEVTSLYASAEDSKSTQSNSQSSSTLTLTAGVSFGLGASSSLNLEYENQQGSGAGSEYTAQFSRSPPAGPGSGYLLSAQDGTAGESETAQLIYHGDHARDQMEIDRTPTNMVESVNLAGSVEAIGGRVMSSLPINGAYGLVQVGGLPGVEVYSSNQPMGETDSHGDLIVTQLGAYSGNQINIDDHDIPVDYRIDAAREYVAPPYRGGAVIAFPVRPVRSFVGKLLVMLDGRPVVPTFGELTMTANGKTFISPIGRDGAFFLDSPPLGRYPARIDFDNGSCEFAINIPDLGQPFVRLGTLRCTMQ